MSFLAILLALVAEQLRPLPVANPVHAWLRHWAAWVSRHLDAGRQPQGWMAWTAAVVVPALLAALVYALMAHWAWPLALLWTVAVLYCTMGLRQFSQHIQAVRDALQSADELRAQQALAKWLRVSAVDMPKNVLLQRAAAQAVQDAHRQLLGVLVCFALGALLGLGPAGAVLYRMAEFAARHWPRQADSANQPTSAPLRESAQQAWALIDWLPTRLSALSFAIVGNFEDAMEQWRNLGEPAPNDTLLLATASGALHMRLVGAGVAADGDTALREVTSAHLPQVMGLIWRALTMWLLLLALLSLARLLG